jgi:hypothetical protein
MARPGMTEGTPADDAPEVGRMDLDPGRNVGTAPYAHSAPPPPGGMPSQAELNQAQAEARREASAPSYKQPEKIESGKNGRGILLIGGAILLIILALLFFLD